MDLQPATDVTTRATLRQMFSKEKLRIFTKQNKLAISCFYYHFIAHQVSWTTVLRCNVYQARADKRPVAINFDLIRVYDCWDGALMNNKLLSEWASLTTALALFPHQADNSLLIYSLVEWQVLDACDRNRNNFLEITLWMNHSWLRDLKSERVYPNSFSRSDGRRMGVGIPDPLPSQRSKS